MQTIQHTLSKEQKQAIGLLSIGTFLEYFDLMLYVHMAVLLNELFFPKYDPFTSSLLSAFSICITFVFRPLGALLFGWIGDTIGRKHTVTITTFMMAISCVIMATLPTYAQLGITAAWIVTICRIVQGISSMGEIVGAEIYLTELVKPPIQYPAVMLIAICSILGGTAALGIASLVTLHGFNWRIAFWIGAGTAIIGTIARTALRETPEFANAKHQLEKVLENAKINKSKLAQNLIFKQRVNKMTSIALLLIQFGWPTCFYFVYIHCGNILKNQFGYSAEQVIYQNFIVSMINLAGYIGLFFLCRRVHPLVILKAKALIFLPVLLISPYLLANITSPTQLFFIQSFFILFVLSTNPATPVFYKHLPVFRRFTYGSMIYAISRALMHIITSFCLIYLINFFGHVGLLIVMLPVNLGFLLGVLHFDKLEKVSNNLLNHSLPQANSAP